MNRSLLLWNRAIHAITPTRVLFLLTVYLVCRLIVSTYEMVEHKNVIISDYETEVSQLKQSNTELVSIIVEQNKIIDAAITDKEVSQEELLDVRTRTERVVTTKVITRTSVKEKPVQIPSARLKNIDTIWRKK